MAAAGFIIEQYIKNQRAAGVQDGIILANLIDLPGEAGKAIKGFVKDARQQGVSPTQALGEVFGLKRKISVAEPKREVNKNPTIADKAKSVGLSALAGFADSAAGVAQGINYAADKLSHVANDNLGTHFATDSTEKYNKNYKRMNNAIDDSRAQAGRTGVDAARFVGDVAGTVPTFALSGLMGSGAKGAALFMAKEGAIGAGTGLVHHADNADQRMSNTAFGAIGGAIGGVVGEKVIAPVIRKAGGKIARTVANHTPPSGGAGGTAQAAEKLVDDAINTTRTNIADDVRQQLIRDAEQFLKTGKEVDGTALVRKKLLENYGVKGTQAQITRDPALWTAEREAAKYSTDLNNVHIANHQQLDDLMRKLVDDTGAQPVDNYNRVSGTFKTLKQADEAAQTNVNQLYDAARNASGNDAQLNHLRFIDQTHRELEANGLGSFMSGDIKGIFKGMFDDPNFVLTHAKSEEIVKVINKRLRSTSDGNERYALGIIKDNLTKETDRTINEMTGLLGNGASDGGLAGAKDAWQTARGAARQRFETLESTPMLKAAVDGVEPDKALNRHVLNGNAADIVRTVDVLKNTQGGEQAIADMQGAVIEHFLSKAKSPNGEAFSPAGLHRALNSFGDQRLKALFTPAQIARLNDIKQVADILVQQPLGAHVNHSNTGSVLIKQLLNIASGLSKGASKIPMIGNAALGIANGVASAGKKGAAIKMLDGQVPVTPNSTLGLTPEMMQMLGLATRGASAVTAATGATMGSN